MTTEHALVAQDLTLAYDSTPVVRDLSVDVPPGRVSVIVGANACGKSTLLRGLARLLSPVSGSVCLDGKSIHAMPTKAVATLLGLLPQAPVAPEGIRVSDLVGRGRYPHQGWFRTWTKDDDEAVAQALLATDTLELASRPVDELSGGQRQRVWIAMALAQDTDLLLLDEPTTFLDVSHQVEVLDVLTDLNRRQGTTIVIVLHDLNLAARYADHLIAMKEGSIMSEGEPSAVVTAETVEAVFGMASRIVRDPVSGTPMVVPIGRHHSGAAKGDAESGSVEPALAGGTSNEREGRTMSRELTYYRTRLVDSERLTPHLRRVVLAGDELAGWTSSGVPDEALLLVVPDATGAVDAPGRHNDYDYDNCRWYTVRHFDADRSELTIDVVGHDIGLATRWARRARPGAAVAVSSVRHWYARPADARWQLLLGDITAVPAIGRMLDERPGVPTVVRIEIADPRDEVPLAVGDDVSVEWVHNDGPSRLHELARTAALPGGPGYTFVAGEAAATRAVRRYLRHELGLPAARYSVVGYWRDRSEEWMAKYRESGIDLETIYAAGEAAGRDEEELADEVDRRLIAAGL